MRSSHEVSLVHVGQIKGLFGFAVFLLLLFLLDPLGLSLCFLVKTVGHMLLASSQGSVLAVQPLYIINVRKLYPFDTYSFVFLLSLGSVLESLIESLIGPLLVIGHILDSQVEVSVAVILVLIFQVWVQALGFLVLDHIVQSLYQLDDHELAEVDPLPVG